MLEVRFIVTYLAACNPCDAPEVNKMFACFSEDECQEYLERIRKFYGCDRIDPMNKMRI